MKIRKAKKEDLLFLLKLRNDPEVRAVSFNTNEIDIETHKKWFEKKLADKNCLMLIIEEKGVEIGQVRFDKDSAGEDAEVNIALVKEFRGKGYGTRILQKTCEYALKYFGVQKILAHIKSDNISSIKSFSKAGFQSVGIVEYKEMPCVEMIYDCTLSC